MCLFSRELESWEAGFPTRSEELVQIRTLLDENAALKEQVAALTEENTLLQQDKYELNTLRSLMDLSEQYSEYPKEGARIISRDSGNWYSSFIIDKGYEDGIGVDMNVIAGGRSGRQDYFCGTELGKGNGDYFR